MVPDRDGWFSRADLEALVGVPEVRELISRGRPRMVERSWANEVTGWLGFPDPVVIYPRGTAKPLVRLWLRDEVERWMDGYRPGWRDLPPAPPEARRD